MRWNNPIRRTPPVAAVALFFLLLAGPLAACSGIAVTALPPHMNQRGAR